MKLKKIRMVGFKSFANETTIGLENEITCIVGPNGCGKSNIIDAVRWVLGEKSARGLRGQQMEDLIFLGSSLRQPAGMAEVEIYFDNRDRTLKVDQDEVVIGRRLYVSSASEYYINEKRTTRRELEKIFLDTGIGKISYSIIEQGKISEILCSTPEARRNLLDEAAGISRFKIEREETLDHLKETGDNLLRLNDIITTKQKDIKNLEQQAQKTRQYIKYKEKLDQHDRCLRYLEISQAQKKYKKAEDQLSALMEKREKNLIKARQFENKQQEMNQANQRQLAEVHSLDRQYHQNLATLVSLEKRQKQITKEEQESHLRIKQMGKHFNEESKKYKSMQVKLDEVKQLQLHLETDLQKLKQQVSDNKEETKQLRQKVEVMNEQEKVKESKIKQKEKKHASLLNALKDVAHELILELEQKKQELKSSEELRHNLKWNIQTKLKEATLLLRKAIQSAQQGSSGADILKDLENIGIAKLLQDFEQYDAIEQEFRSLLFDPSGLLARKEALDQNMLELSGDINGLKKDNQQLQTERKRILEILEERKNKRQALELQIRDHEVRKETHNENYENNELLLREVQERLSYFNKEKSAQEKSLQSIHGEKNEIEKQLKELTKQGLEQAKKLTSLRPKIDVDNQAIEGMGEKIKQIREGLEQILPRISEQERLAEQIRVHLRQNEEALYTDFQIQFENLQQEYESLVIHPQKEEQEFRRLQKEIRELGSFNALALEELDKSNEELRLLEEQRTDVENSRRNIWEAIKEMDQRSNDIFQDTFAQVQEKFQQSFQKLFDGGQVSLKLTDPESILTSGIDIMVQPPGKKNSSIALLSGGEQSMTAIALIFAIYIIRPSPFCFLDEIDAPLDDINIRRFVEMLREYTSSTQFILVTHNKLTMSYSSAIFGITQEEAGVSRIISVKLVQQENEKQTA